MGRGSDFGFVVGGPWFENHGYQHAPRRGGENGLAVRCCAMAAVLVMLWDACSGRCFIVIGRVWHAFSVRMIFCVFAPGVSL